MGVLVYIENNSGKFKKSAFEVLSYASDLSNLNGEELICLVNNLENDSDAEILSEYGAQKVINLKDQALKSFDAAAYSKAIHDVLDSNSCKTLVLSNTYAGKSIAPRVAAKNNASMISEAISLPDIQNNYRTRRAVYSNKGFAEIELSNENKVIALSANSYKLVEKPGSVSVQSMEIGVGSDDVKSTVKGQKLVTGKIPLTEAELVISGGRGLKGPENWHLIENLAGELGAGTSCSKPVSDMDWRPHEEHVGQTGITIKPNLYIACGISGAIQHLAGVSSSKVIVVVNTDPEAPFFKIADYGVIGDVFEVLPKLTEAIKAYKA